MMILLVCSLKASPATIMILLRIGASLIVFSFLEIPHSSSGTQEVAKNRRQNDFCAGIGRTK